MITSTILIITLQSEIENTKSSEYQIQQLTLDELWTYPVYFDPVVLDETGVGNAFKDLDLIRDVFYCLVIIWLEAYLRESNIHCN